MHIITTRIKLHEMLDKLNTEIKKLKTISKEVTTPVKIIYTKVICTCSTLVNCESLFC